VKRLVITPTYNEAENIVRLIEAIRAADPAIDILVVDDGSPDGTADLAEAQPGVHVMRRPGKLGLGTAYKAGFAWALDQGYEAVAQMDADFSHSPTVLPQLFNELANFDLVIGSRYVPGGGTENWGWHRRFLSSRANFTARVILNLQPRDVTSGFRAYRIETVQAIRFGSLKSEGYAFLVEIAYRCQRLDLRMGEVPIVFVDRELGTSKMSVKEIIGGVKNLLRLRISGSF
jgi:dolichol-phosphate mannosyltransferase